MKKILYSVCALALAAVSFSSCEDVPSPYNDPTQGGGGGVIVDPNAPKDSTGDGTMANPFNVPGAIKYIAAGGDQTKLVYVKGKIADSPQIDTGYGNATYNISTDGSATNTLKVYRGYAFGNKKFTATDEIKKADEVVICGKLGTHGTTKELLQGNYIYSLNGKTMSSGGTIEIVGTPSGEGTAASPYNIAKALTLISEGKMSEDKVYISGIISEIEEIDYTNYGNATYYLSDDGGTKGQLKVFRGYSFKGDKFTSASIKKGDKVVILGKLINYNNTTPEVAQGNQLVTVNGQGGGGSSVTPDPGTVTGEAGTVAISGLEVTLANSKLTAGTSTVTIDFSKAGVTDGESNPTVTLSDGSTLVFGAGGEENAPKVYKKYGTIRVYKNNTITFNGKQKVAKIVMTCDQYTDKQGKKNVYVGNATATVVFKDNKAQYKNVFTGAGGGTQLRIKTVTIVYAQ